jgi:hypothetical protein
MKKIPCQGSNGPGVASCRIDSRTEDCQCAGISRGNEKWVGRLQKTLKLDLSGHEAQLGSTDGTRAPRGARVSSGPAWGSGRGNGERGAPELGGRVSAAQCGGGDGGGGLQVKRASKRLLTALAVPQLRRSTRKKWPGG